MSASVFFGATLLGLAGYSAAATLIARRTARRHLPKVAAVISAVALGVILAFSWSREVSPTVQDVIAWAVAACFVVLPAVAVTTGVAMHLATTASPPARSWVLRWAAGVAVLLPSLFLAFAAAVAITGEGP